MKQDYDRLLQLNAGYLIFCLIMFAYYLSNNMWSYFIEKAKLFVLMKVKIYVS